MQKQLPPARHYNAFISYRHTPRDMQTASRVQRMLEQMRIPRAIQKQTGVRRIEHIFRDKEDLSITADLNDTIADALGHSDYLIVICSPEAKESVWVQKEIEFFLQTHTRSQILTVLSAGEPEDVIPEILRYEDIETESGTTRITREPLCCDFRLPKAKAKREELPRLAAALLGCSYDDLRQRQRQYRARRTAIILSILSVLMFALTAYFAWSAIQIRRNYEQALVNQSQYLASESGKHLADGDRLTAMLLALSALPQDAEQSDRPIVPIAIDSLVQASYAYVSPGANIYALQYAYPHTGNVAFFVPSQDGSRLLTVSGFYTATFWDADTKTVLYTEKFPTAIQTAKLDANGNFILLTDQVTCLDGKTGEKLWVYAPTAGQYLAGDFACARDKGIICCSTSTGAIVLDASTGQLLGDYAARDAADRTMYCMDMAVSDDGKTMAAATLSGDAIVIWDLESAACRMVENPMTYVCDMAFDEDHNLFANISATLNMNLTYAGEQFLTGHQEAILKISPKGRILAQTDFSHAQVSHINDVSFMDYAEPNGEKFDAALVTSGNCCHVFNRINGQLIRRIEFPAPITAVTAKDGQITAILSDGQRAYYACHNGIVITTHCFVENIFETAITEGAIFCAEQNSESVLVYRTGVYDSAWTCILDEAVTEQMQLEKGLLILTESGDLALIDDQGAITWAAKLDMANCLTFDVLGQSENGKTAVLYVYGQQMEDDLTQTYICLVDMADGKQEFLTVDSLARHFTVADDRLYYTVEEDGTCFIGIFHLSTHQLEVVELEQMLLPNDLFVSGDQIAVTTGDGETYLADKNGACTLLCTAQTPPDIPLVTFGEEGQIALLMDDAVHVFSKNQEELCSIALNGLTLRDACFHEECIYLVTSDGKLAKYDGQSGEFLGETDVIGAEYTVTQVLWQWEEDTLSLRIGSGLNLIDLNHFARCTRVENCAAHFVDTGRIFTLGQSANGYNRVGTFTQYDLAALIARARTQLDGLTLTPQQCAEFGVVAQQPHSDIFAAQM